MDTNDHETMDMFAGKVGESEAEKHGKALAADKLTAIGDTGGLASGKGSEADLDRQPCWQPVYPGSGRLTGKVAIVTGGDSGIGRAVAALFAREGADVAIFYNSNDDDAADTIRIIENEGRNGVAIKGDVGRQADCARCVMETVAKFGSLDILVNNAAEQHPADDIADISEEQLQRTFRTNIFGMFFMVQAAQPHLNPGSSIINCTSVVMYKGAQSLLDYSATKGAITAFTRSLSENLVAQGIRVNAVAPGRFGHPSTRWAARTRIKCAILASPPPMQRPGEPNEVAPAFLFLACADSSYMSGQVLHPNGGVVING